MIDQVTAVTALSTLVSVLLLWVLLHWFYRDFHVDNFRQKVFALRDELFDLARAGVVAFDDPAYTTLRDTMNGLIRFADRIGIVGVALAILTMSREEKEEYESFHAMLARLSDHLTAEQREAVESIDQRMQFLIAEHLIFGSPTLFALLLPPAIALLIKHASSHVMRKLRRDVSRRFADPVSAIALQVGAEMA